MPSGSFVFSVDAIIPATPTTRIVRLGLRGEDFAFEAGQAALIGPADQDVRIPYSIASAPIETFEHGWLDFLIKIEEPSGRWGHQFNGMHVGMAMAVQGPLGSFLFPANPAEDHFLFIAGGTGIAPMRSMIRHARAMGHRGRISVLYSARTPLDFAYRGELRGMARRGELRLVLTATRGPDDAWRGQRGRITATQLELLLDDPATLCFVCGPATMVDDVPRMWRQLGVEKSRIRIEEG